MTLKNVNKTQPLKLASRTTKSIIEEVEKSASESEASDSDSKMSGNDSDASVFEDDVSDEASDSGSVVESELEESELEESEPDVKPTKPRKTRELKPEKNPELMAAAIAHVKKEQALQLLCEEALSDEAEPIVKTEPGSSSVRRRLRDLVEEAEDAKSEEALNAEEAKRGSLKIIVAEHHELQRIAKLKVDKASAAAEATKKDDEAVATTLAQVTALAAPAAPAATLATRSKRPSHPHLISPPIPPQAPANYTHKVGDTEVTDGELFTPPSTPVKKRKAPATPVSTVGQARRTSRAGKAKAQPRLNL